MTAHHPLRVVIVDDEEPARLALAEALRHVPDVTLLAQCQNGFEAVKVVSETQPDAMLLDVQMPKLDGFDVLELVGADVPVVFVTAHDAFAIRAFDVHAGGYLLKPVSSERLQKALERVRERGRLAAPEARAMRAAARPSEGTLERVVIRDGAQVHVIPVDRIDYVEAQDDYVGFRTAGKLLLKEQTMSEVEGALDQHPLVPVHG